MIDGVEWYLVKVRTDAVHDLSLWNVSAQQCTRIADSCIRIQQSSTRNLGTTTTSSSCRSPVEHRYCQCLQNAELSKRCRLPYNCALLAKEYPPENNERRP
ncbi:hypothetical protein BYT27DRAFT_6872549 [Phlegmacium glaucopus]|nr:hypothetical protein BYT27DRAFT_6872549 [Phlegmacium glaucopus]